MISEGPCNTQTRVGYRSKMFDIDTDTLTSIPVPKRYFFQYKFYEINFNKITFSKKKIKKTLVSFFQLLDVYTDSKTPEPLHKGTKYIQHNKSANNFNKAQIVFSLLICKATFTLVHVRFKTHSLDRIIIYISFPLIYW